jgi:hypothetical protein
MVLTMVYNTQNYCFFFTFPIVRYSREQKTRRFGNWNCFRPQVKAEKTPTQLGSLERANLNHWTTSGLKWLNGCVNLTRVVQWLRLALSKWTNRVSSSPFTWGRKYVDPVFGTSCFLFSRIPDDGKSPKTQWFYVTPFVHCCKFDIKINIAVGYNSGWEANSRLIGHQILRLLWNLGSSMPSETLYHSAMFFSIVQNNKYRVILDYCLGFCL